MNIRQTIGVLLYTAFMTAMFISCDYDDAVEVDVVELGSIEDEYTVPAEGGSVVISMYANSDYSIELSDDADWLAYIPEKPSEDTLQLTVRCSYNESFRRMAELVLCSDIDDRRDTVYIKQEAFKEAYMSMDDASVSLAGAGGSTVVTVKTNISEEEIECTISYTDLSSTGWIEDISFFEDSSSETLIITIEAEANPDSAAPRTAAVYLSYTDGWGELVALEFNAVQRNSNETLGEAVSFEDFRSDYSSGGEVEDYVTIEGIVVSNPVYLNAGENTQSTTSSIDYTVCEKTVYLESLDGKYGFAIETASEDDNVFEQYDYVELLLTGATVTVKSNPTRYELSDVTKSMVVTRTSGSVDDLPVKEMHIADLTDDDIYTYVTLLDVEFPIRKGGLFPVQDGYTNSANYHRLSKYATLLRDINGDAMYVMTNSTCLYRRDGTRTPDGSGNVSGVIVHERYSRYEWKEGADMEDVDDDPELGYIGRYELRHQTAEDIWGDMNMDVEDGFSALLAEYRFWNPDATNYVMKPSYGTNGWLDHTYQTQYTGSSSKNFLYSTYGVRMYSTTAYDYLGPCGYSESGYFGKNWGNQNGIGVIIDEDNESWLSSGSGLVSYNPDGTVEWCGPYASSGYAAEGTSGWPGNDAITQTNQVNYYSTPGTGQVANYCFTTYGNTYWWDTTNDRFYAWLINFSTKGISTDQLSLQISTVNTTGACCPRYWIAEWATTDSQDEDDDSQWQTIGEYTVPDLSVWSVTTYYSLPGFKQINFTLPTEMLGYGNVYIRLRPVSDVCGSYPSYGYADSTIGEMSSYNHYNYLNYIAIRYNK